MEIEVRTFSVSKNSWALSVIEQYLKKIRPYEKIDIRYIKDEKKWPASIENFDQIWICDERGQALSSVEFSKNISRLRDGGIKKLLILVGGPFGLPKELVERAHKSVLLSPFVLNQEVALTVLFEQIFRAYTIIQNHPYHNE